MQANAEDALIQAFRRAAGRVPAYAQILREAGVSPQAVRSLEDFRRLVPVIDKQATFSRFAVADLCVDGKLPPLAGVLTSSGHSGRFAFGLYDLPGAEAEVRRTDDALDALFAVRSRPTLLVNCLPMGVKVPTRACTLAETSVRADMVTGVVAQFSRHYHQIVLVGETAFIKHVLESGQDQGIDWTKPLIHVIVGEEPLAENARKYLEGILGIDRQASRKGLVVASMGVAELGLNLFSEDRFLIALRRIMHEDRAWREAIAGRHATVLPMVFKYDPSHIFTEIGKGGRLVISTLDIQRPLPLIRYATGDLAALPAPQAVTQAAQQKGLAPGPAGLSLLLVFGRGECAKAGATPVYPEQVKEGLYHDPNLARLMTGNFRMRSGDKAVALRIQLCPAASPQPSLEQRLAGAMSQYVPAPLRVQCQRYEEFADGMSLNYERKFQYAGQQGDLTWSR